MTCVNGGRRFCRQRRGYQFKIMSNGIMQGQAVSPKNTHPANRRLTIAMFAFGPSGHA